MYGCFDITRAVFAVGDEEGVNGSPTLHRT